MSRSTTTAAFAFDRGAARKAWELEEDQFADQPWAWTLQWNRITPKLVVGTCPCTTDDVERLMEEEGIEAFVSIQSDKEMASLDVDYHALYEYTLSRGGVMHRFATCEQNVYEWVQQLPHALRTVIANLNAGRKTYVYGTQSQQRVAYILVMYFCWFEKLNMDEAMAEVGRLRPASKANVDLWLDVHGKLCLDETHGQRQARLYTQRCHPWGKPSSLEHWFKGFVVSVERAINYPGEHPNARQLEKM